MIGLRSDWRETRYSLAEILAETILLNGGTGPFPCKWCERIGFACPRQCAGRIYYACKFCGVFQNADAGPYRCVRYICLHGDRRISGWSRDPGGWRCDRCGSWRGPESAEDWPVDDRRHIWNLAPESGTLADYAEFWGKVGNEETASGVWPIP